MDDYYEPFTLSYANLFDAPEGDNYARTLFMANLNQAMRVAGVDLDGELPDHRVPVLRYLDSVACPLAELDAVK